MKKMSKLEGLKVELVNLQTLYNSALDDLVKATEWKNKAEEVIAYLMDIRGKIFFTDEEQDVYYGMMGKVKRLLEGN